MFNNTLFKALIDKFGDKQLIVAIEELSELQKELCKHLRGKTDVGHIAEEIADVCIMLCQLMLYFNIREIDVLRVIDEKIKRTEERLLGGE